MAPGFSVEADPTWEPSVSEPQADLNEESLRLARSVAAQLLGPPPNTVTQTVDDLLSHARVLRSRPDDDAAADGAFAVLGAAYAKYGPPYPRGDASVALRA